MYSYKVALIDLTRERDSYDFELDFFYEFTSFLRYLCILIIVNEISVLRIAKPSN